MEQIGKTLAGVLAPLAPATREKPRNIAGSGESVAADNFGLDPYTPELREAIAAAHKFLAAAGSNQPIWLSLLGNCGAGKTHLARELYRRYQPRQVRRPDASSAAGYRITHQKKQSFRWQSIVQTMRSGDFGIVDYIAGVDFAVIDDLGAGYDSDLTKAKASDLAEWRIGKPTIWTSNLDLEQIAEQIDARLTSRLLRHGSIVVTFEKTVDWNVRQYQGR